MKNRVADLLAEIERASFAPDGQVTFTAAEILRIADELLELEIYPAMVGASGGYFVRPYQTAIIGGQEAYELPERTLMMAIREVKIVSGQSVRDLDQIEFENISSVQPGQPDFFYMRENSVVLYPEPSSSTGDLLMFYYQRANKLIDASSCATITAVDTATNTVTVTATPSDWVTGKILDIVKGTGGHELRGMDLTSTLIAANEISFAALPSGVAVGDELCPQYYTSLVQVPSGFVRALARGVAAEILKNMNQPPWEKLREDYQTKFTMALQLITPRVVGAPKVVVSPLW